MFFADRQRKRENLYMSDSKQGLSKLKFLSFYSRWMVLIVVYFTENSNNIEEVWARQLMNLGRGSSHILPILLSICVPTNFV